MNCHFKKCSLAKNHYGSRLNLYHAQSRPAASRPTMKTNKGNRESSCLSRYPTAKKRIRRPSRSFRIRFRSSRENIPEAQRRTYRIAGYLSEETFHRPSTSTIETSTVSGSAFFSYCTSICTFAVFPSSESCSPKTL